MSKPMDINERNAAYAGDDELAPVSPVERITVRPKGAALSPGGSSSSSAATEHHGAVEMVTSPDPGQQPPLETTVAELEAGKGRRFAFLKRPQFWIVLALSHR
ncbi:hypothetical protein LTR82_011591, partial [Friedmanniomyces endolithicus]